MAHAKKSLFLLFFLFLPSAAFAGSADYHCQAGFPGVKLVTITTSWSDYVARIYAEGANIAPWTYGGTTEPGKVGSWFQMDGLSTPGGQTCSKHVLGDGDTWSIGCSSTCKAEALALGVDLDNMVSTGGVLSLVDGSVVETDGTITPPGSLTPDAQAIKDFLTTGVRFDINGDPVTVVPANELPLVGGRCLQLLGGTGVHCFGEGTTSGTTYDTYRQFGIQKDPVNVELDYKEVRTDGLDLFDSRDRDLEGFAGDPSVTDITIDTDGGRFVDPDTTLLYFPPTNWDGTPYLLSPDITTKINATPPCVSGCSGPLFDGALGDNVKQKGTVTEAITQLGSPTVSGGGSNVRTNIEPDKVTISFRDTGEVISQIDIAGETLSGVDRANIESLLDAGGYVGSGDIVTGSGTGPASGTVSIERNSSDAGLPGGNAPQPSPGSTGSSSLGAGGFYTPVFPTETFLSVFQAHYTAWQQEALFTALSNFAPTLGSGLPSFCFTTNQFGQHCVDFANYSGTFDLIGYIVLLLGGYMAIRIIITRTEG